MKLLYSLLLFICSLNVYSATYFVATNGSDTNPGTIDRPFSTFYKANSKMLAGDTVYVRGGTYKQRFVITKSGTSGNKILISNYNNELVTVDGNVNINGGQGTDQGYWEGQIHVAGGVSNIIINGFKVINTRFAGIMGDRANYITATNNKTYNTCSSGINFHRGTNITIAYNDVSKANNGCSQENITVASVTNFAIYNNKVHDSGKRYMGGRLMGSEGIDAKSSSAYGNIYNNIVYNTTALGLYVDGYASHIHDIKVYNNMVFNSNQNGIQVTAEEQGGSVNAIDVFNNVVYKSRWCGICITKSYKDSVSTPMSNIRVYNNTSYGNGTNGNWGSGIEFDNPLFTGVSAVNNLTGGNNGPGIDVSPNSYVSLLKNLNTTTGYVDTANNNFHLTNLSKARHTGSTSLYPSIDYDYIKRIAPPSIGAYE